MLWIYVSVKSSVHAISFRHDNQIIGPTPLPIQQHSAQSDYFLGSPQYTPFTGLNLLDYGVLSNSLHDSIEHYFDHNGRVVKQYHVDEYHEENPYNHIKSSFAYRLPSLEKNLQPSPFYSYPSYPSASSQVDPYLYPGLYTSLEKTNVKSLLSKNHGPVAIGSGSLGYIQVPGGSVHLGSGSYGYISHKDHENHLSTIFERRSKPLDSGPLSFGHHHL